MIEDGDIPETRLVPSTSLAQSSAARAAAAIADAGGSPRAQIDAARANDHRRITYIPHQGKKERMRRMARMSQQKVDES